MRSILEKAFVALLNEEHDKAEELFHKFIVERARQIHESNRAGDDYVLDENWNDEITTESYFTEDDLAGLEDDGAEHEEHGEDLDGDGDTDEPGEEDAKDEFDGEEAGEEFKDDDLDDESGEGDLGGEESSDERIDHLEDQIEKLTAEFEAMMDAIGDEGEEAEEAGDEVADEFGADEHDLDGDEDEEEAEHVEDDMDGTDDEPAMESADDEFDDITESIIDELEKVSVTLDDGHEVGTGGKFTQNKSASIPQKNKDARQGGQPIKMKQDAHKGFERETAPPVETLKPRRNNVKTTDAALTRVSKEGDKSAELNKLSSETGNTKSPLEGK